MQRTLTINIGDWSQDGHNRFESYLITVKGDDVTDTSLKNSYQHTVQDTGIDLLEVCSDYGEANIDFEVYELLCEKGFVPSEQVNFGAAIFVDDPYEKEEKEFAAIDLIMFYVGREIPNFSWERVEFPTLIGGSNTILVSEPHHFGYGIA